MIYLDTGCLVKLYYPEPESTRIAAYVQGKPICYTPLHALEFANALQLKVFSRTATSEQVAAAIALLDEGATVPFIARYRKEATGGLDDTQLRLLEERLSYLRELEERREAVLNSIQEQGKLTPELRGALNPLLCSIRATPTARKTRVFARNSDCLSAIMGRQIVVSRIDKTDLSA